MFCRDNAAPFFFNYRKINPAARPIIRSCESCALVKSFEVPKSNRFPRAIVGNENFAVLTTATSYPAPTCIYGSRSHHRTFNPRDSKDRQSKAALSPSKLETPPPVTKIYFVCLSVRISSLKSSRRLFPRVFFY